MSKLPPVADVERIAGSLKTDKERQRVRGLADSLRKAQSCIADLRLAQQCCHVLAQYRQMFSALEPFEKALIQHSMLSNAVILYARATAGESKRGGRGSHSVAAQLPSELRESHDSLISLRNRVVAHVHSNEQLRGEPWNQSFAFVVDEGFALRPGAATTPIKIRDDLLQDLEKLAPAAEAVIQARYQRYLAQLGDVLRAMEWKDLAPHFVDPASLFGSESQARAVLDGRDAGKTVGISAP